jgi:hypothetical protein
MMSLQHLPYQNWLGFYGLSLTIFIGKTLQLKTNSSLFFKVTFLSKFPIDDETLPIVL